jgi:hypothetical protein
MMSFHVGVRRFQPCPPHQNPHRYMFFLHTYNSWNSASSCSEKGVRLGIDPNIKRGLLFFFGFGIVATNSIIGKLDYLLVVFSYGGVYS